MSHPLPAPIDLTHIAPSVSVGADQTHLQLKQGTARNPSGVEISADRYSLLLNGRHWMPVMGEMHYSRYHRSGWRDELLKMKAAGIDIVATYVFWIHHEEIEGQFDFTGQRSLRAFALLCRELDLRLAVRCGPWAHGECRNGGFPDWLLRKGYFAEVPKEAEEQAEAEKVPCTGYALRSDDPGYLALARRFYQEIAGQLDGLLWKDGGPVIAIQIENEYSGPSEHLLTLKQMALDAGLDVPIYTFTGWPKPSTPMPFGHLLPLFGIYAEGMWDRNIEVMAGGYWEAFTFKPHRINTDIGSDHFGVREAKDEKDVARYPFLMCELGGGMVVSYHRRIKLSTADVVAPALIKLGSGNSLPGYYVFHGGTNPDGKLSTFNESQATNYPNDLTVKTYDFAAPLGEFGQVREHYHWLRRMHLFIHDYGERLAIMTPVFAHEQATGKTDIKTLRWCVRSDGSSAFIFCNNYQRLQPMPSKSDVQFTLHTKGGDVIVPRRPTTVAGDSFFVWPVNVDLGGVNLVYATAEILCNLDVGDTRYVFFSESAGVPAEFVFDDSARELTTASALTREDGRFCVEQMRPGLDVAIRMRTPDGKKLHIVLLDQKTSLACWKIAFGGSDHVVLTSANLLAEEKGLRCQTMDAGNVSLSIFPQPGSVHIGGEPAEERNDGIFACYTLPESDAAPLAVSVEQIKKPAPARSVPMGRFGVAEAPGEEEFERAAVWRVKLPANLDSLHNTLLHLDYVGDVARVYLDGRLLTDNFYNGTPFEIGLDPYAPDVYRGELLVKILPLRKDAPICLLPESWPDHPTLEGTAELRGVELLQTRELQLTVLS